MASLIIISWRDIPAQVLVKRGRERFQSAVEHAHNPPVATFS